jgi:hypothetical protein
MGTGGVRDLWKHIVVVAETQAAAAVVVAGQLAPRSVDCRQKQGAEGAEAWRVAFQMPAAEAEYVQPLVGEPVVTQH